MANRAVDLVITYRVVKLLATPFERQEAFKYGQYVLSTLNRSKTQAASTPNTFCKTII